MEPYRGRPSRKSDEIWLLSYADLITNLLIFFIALFSMADISKARMQQIQESLSGKSQPRSLKSIESTLAREIEEKGYRDVLKVELTDRGVELSLNSGVVFPIGSEKIEERWLPILDAVLAKVVQYADAYDFAVEGHTDETPIRSGGRFSSNWELASSRALQIRDRLEKVGVPATKLRVESYGETRQLRAELLENLSPEEVKNRHRRVVIRIF